MGIELDLSTNEYLGIISETIERGSGGRGLYEKYLDYPDYIGCPVIDPNGCFTGEYIDTQQGDGSIYLSVVNKFFNSHSSLYSIEELIVDGRQLDATNKGKVDLSKPKNIIFELLRSPEVRPLVENYISEHEFFAVTPDMKKTHYLQATPKDAIAPPQLKETEDRFLEALSKIKPDQKSTGLPKRLTIAAYGGLLTYGIELATHPQWHDIGRGYIAAALYSGDPSSLINVGSDLLSRGIEFLPTQDGAYVVLGCLGGLALSYLPDLPKFLKDLQDKHRSRTMKKEDILDKLLEE